MSNDESFIVDLSGYENSLAKQFRLMEVILELSKKERVFIMEGTTDSLMKNTEEKEAALDRFSLLEEDMKKYLQKMVLKLGVQTERTNIQDVLSFLKVEDSNRITRLLDGISSLVEKTREINLGNQALVVTRMDWVLATQSFLASLTRPQECYSMPLMDGYDRNTPVSGLEFRV